MTNEQREAIDRLRRGLDDIWFATLYSQEEMDKDIETVLSLIKEQQEEIAKYEKIYKEYDCYRWVKELDKKNKQIDLMAEEIIMTKPANCTRTNEFNTEKVYMSKEEIKQYFADLVEKE